MFYPLTTLFLQKQSLGHPLRGIAYDACHISSYSNSCRDLLRKYHMVSSVEIFITGRPNKR